MINQAIDVKYIMTKEAADLLNVTKGTLYNWHKNGKLVPSYVNPLTKRRYYLRENVDKLLDEE